jgi:hypothetical protein
LILPAPTAVASMEQMTKLDTILIINDTNQSSSIEPRELETKDYVINKY